LCLGVVGEVGALSEDVTLYILDVNQVHEFSEVATRTRQSSKIGPEGATALVECVVENDATRTESGVRSHEVCSDVNYLSIPCRLNRSQNPIDPHERSFAIRRALCHRQATGQNQQQNQTNTKLKRTHFASPPFLESTTLVFAFKQTPHLKNEN
jgi:hypothetical protein